MFSVKKNGLPTCATEQETFASIFFRKHKNYYFPIIFDPKVNISPPVFQSNPKRIGVEKWKMKNFVRNFPLVFTRNKFHGVSRCFTGFHGVPPFRASKISREMYAEKGYRLRFNGCSSDGRLIAQLKSRCPCKGTCSIIIDGARRNFISFQ